MRINSRLCHRKVWSLKMKSFLCMVPRWKECLDFGLRDLGADLGLTKVSSQKDIMTVNDYFKKKNGSIHYQLYCQRHVHIEHEHVFGQYLNVTHFIPPRWLTS